MSRLSRFRIFGVGWCRTGTTSLGIALETLGFKVHGGFGDPRIESQYNFRRIESYAYAASINKYGWAFEDHPWACMWRYLFEWYPDSKFILTVRDPDSWLASCQKVFKNNSTPLREYLYGKGFGRAIDYPEIWRNRYILHNREVQCVIPKRQLLVMTQGKTMHWEPLCKFLNKSVPSGVPYPMLNSEGTRARLDFARKDFEKQSG